MASYDFSAPRLYLDQAVSAGALLLLGKAQHHYLCNVLRLSQGDGILIFNGRDGEWQARLVIESRRQAHLVVERQTRNQPPRRDLHYLFAPLKHARLDYMVQKAVEMGATSLRPVITRRTQVNRLNAGRMLANAIEAAEQCGILDVPDVQEPQPLTTVLDNWPSDRMLAFCDEEASTGHHGLPAEVPDRLAVLVGPEGGFDPSERQMILEVPSAVRLSLGPRILRADTAAVAALTLVQSALGDWRTA
jgi:16S rRNA (uracil1498-N3)-methyltransferase